MYVCVYTRAYPLDVDMHPTGPLHAQDDISMYTCIYRCSMYMYILILTGLVVNEIHSLAISTGMTGDNVCLCPGFVLLSCFIYYRQ